MTQWGLWDTRDRCWIGDSAGPTLYTEGDAALQLPAQLLAEIAAQVVDERLRQSLGRTRARVYDGTGTKLRDSVETRYTTLQALRRIEGGALPPEED